MGTLLITLPTGEIELSKELPISVNIGLNDVKNPEKKTGGYTKSITIDGSKNNNKLMGYLFDINSTFDVFNPNIKTPALLSLSSAEVISGTLQLISIDKTGSVIKYNVLMFDIVADFFSEVGDKLVSELDFSDYDHTFDSPTIQTSWQHTSEDIYGYPNLHTLSDTIKTTDYKAGIFHKAYLLKTASANGYSLGGTFMDKTTKVGAIYDREIIPFSGAIPVVPQATLDSGKAFIGGASDLLLDSLVGIGTGFFNNAWSIVDDQLSTITDEAPPFFDTGGNAALGTYTVPSGGNYEIKGIFNFEITTTESRNISSSVLKLTVFRNGAPHYSTQKSIDSLVTGTSSYSIDIDDVKGLSLGDDVTFKVSFQSSVNDHLIFPVPGIADLTFSFIAADSWFSFEQLGTITDGSTILLNDFLPKKLKQIDIVRDLIKRYNLFISIDKDNPTKLILDTRNDYYDKGGTIDWSNKRDLSKKGKITLLPDLLEKEMLFTYSEGGGDWDKQHKSFYNTIFGEKKIIFNNEFTKGRKEIKTPFASTPLVYNASSTKFVVPAISSIEPGDSIRVLYYKGEQATLDGSSYTWVRDGNPNLTLSTYCYAGCYDDFINPTIDLNFGRVEGLSYAGLQSFATDNLFNLHWFDYVNQINKGRLLTDHFLLTELDIEFIKNNLNTKIFVDDAYYYVNKIIDYNPTINGVTKVELIKTVDRVTFEEVTEEEEVQNGDFVLERTSPFQTDNTLTTSLIEAIPTTPNTINETITFEKKSSIDSDEFVLNNYI